MIPKELTKIMVESCEYKSSPDYEGESDICEKKTDNNPHGHTCYCDEYADEAAMCDFRKGVIAALGFIDNMSGETINVNTSIDLPDEFKDCLGEVFRKEG